MTALLAHAVRDAAAAVDRRPATTAPPSRPGRRRYRRTYRENTFTGRQIIAAAAYRPRDGEAVCPDLAAVQLPAGRRPVLDRAEAVTVLQEHPVNGRLRSDSYPTRMAVCAALADHLDVEAGMATVGHDVLAARASVHAGYRIARSTAGDHARALEDAGALVVAFRGRSRAVAGRDLANVYVITTSADTLPPAEQAAVDELASSLAQDVDGADVPVDELRHHPFRAGFEVETPVAQARMSGHFSSSESAPTRDVEEFETAPVTSDPPPGRPRTPRGGVARPTPGPVRREHPERYAARADAERRIAVAWLLQRLGWTHHQRAEEEMLIICGPFFRAGWPARAIEYALLNTPDGAEHRGPLPGPRTRDRAHQPRIRNLWATLTARLWTWRDPLLRVPVDPPIPTEAPRRGRPPGAVTRRRQLADRVEEMRLDDPRRAVALAALRGEEVTVSWRPRSPEATTALAELRQRTPQGRRRPELRTLLGDSGAGASAAR